MDYNLLKKNVVRWRNMSCVLLLLLFVLNKGHGQFNYKFLGVVNANQIILDTRTSDQSTGAVRCGQLKAGYFLGFALENIMTPKYAWRLSLSYQKDVLQYRSSDLSLAYLTRDGVYLGKGDLVDRLDMASVGLEGAFLWNFSGGRNSFYAGITASANTIISYERELFYEFEDKPDETLEKATDGESFLMSTGFLLGFEIMRNADLSINLEPFVRMRFYEVNFDWNWDRSYHQLNFGLAFVVDFSVEDETGKRESDQIIR